MNNLRRFALVSLVVWVSGCASGAGAAIAAEAAGAGPVTDMPDDYVIGPGDTLNIVVQGEPDLSLAGVAVRPDGKVTTPQVEDMVAVGKTATQLGRDMETVLAKYLRTPHVTVILAQAASAFSQVKIIGAVKEQKFLPYRKGLTVLDVYLAAGGFTEFAAPNNSRINRKEDGKNIEIRVKLGDLVNKSDMRQNHELKPGDILSVPQSRW